MEWFPKVREALGRKQLTEIGERMQKLRCLRTTPPRPALRVEEGGRRAAELIQPTVRGPTGCGQRLCFGFPSYCGGTAVSAAATVGNRADPRRGPMVVLRFVLKASVSSPDRSGWPDSVTHGRRTGLCAADHHRLGLRVPGRCGSGGVSAVRARRRSAAHLTRVRRVMCEAT